MVQRAEKDVSRGLTPELWSRASWSGEQCRKALRALARSPHGAVPVSQLAAELGGDVSLFGLRLWGGGGLHALKSMHEQNLLLRRSYQKDARDIDAAAFGPFCEDVYTLPSAAHLLSVTRMLGQGRL